MTFSIENLKPIQGNTLLASFDVRIIPLCASIRRLKYGKRQDGSSFIIWPNEPYEKDGEKRYFSYVKFDEDKKEKVTTLICSLVEKELAKSTSKTASKEEIFW